VATGREAMPQPGHRSAIRTLVVSPVDGTVVTGGRDGTIRHWDPSTGRELGVITTFESPVDCLAIAPDGQSLLVAQIHARKLALWNITERRQIRDLPRRAERDPVRHVAFGPDGKRVASERRIWDADTGRVLVDFRDLDEQNNRGACYFPTFVSSDGRQVITAEEDGVRVWDMATGQGVRWAVRARIHQDRVALSRDGRYVATGALVARFQGDESAPPIDVWEMASGQKVANLVGHAGSTNGLCFSPDGRWLASCSGDRRTAIDATVRIWDVATGRELGRFSGHDGAVNVLAFSPDGRSVISGGSDGTGLVWDVSDLLGNRPADAPLAREALQARWDELAGADARAAHRATWALSVPSAVPFLRERLRPTSAPDPKVVRSASGPIAPPETLRSLRAIAALERAGTPEARSTIEVMANGHPAAIETREAKASLERLR
jgi:WD40 repeat protein